MRLINAHTIVPIAIQKDSLCNTLLILKLKDKIIKYDHEHEQDFVA